MYLQHWHGWCHMKLQPSRRKFGVHHTTMHHVTACKATYVRCMRVFSASSDRCSHVQCQFCWMLSVCVFSACSDRYCLCVSASSDRCYVCSAPVLSGVMCVFSISSDRCYVCSVPVLTVTGVCVFSASSDRCYVCV